MDVTQANTALMSHTPSDGGIQPPHRPTPLVPLQPSPDAFRQLFDLLRLLQRTDRQHMPVVPLEVGLQLFGQLQQRAGVVHRFPKLVLENLFLL